MSNNIMHKSGRKPTSCACEKCRNQCKTPCLGTPEDIERLIEAGYGDRLSPTEWWAGSLMGVVKGPVLMIQAKREDNGWCTFRRPDGLCELHDKGLKPTEGKLSHHTMGLDNFDPRRSLAWLVAQEWLPLQKEFEKLKIT
ncbi:MAG: hypothetical protein K2M69_05825 [Muribaculaceae bacterium]|nr:hypothetical protein [Muribaculaceae bacterium]